MSDTDGLEVFTRWRNIQAISIGEPWGIWIQAALEDLGFIPSLLPRHNPPSPDQVIRVPRKQRLPIRAPRQTHTLRLPALLTHGRIFRLQLVNLALLLEVEDDDGARRRGAEPVSVRGEDEGVDLVAGGQ